MSVTYSKMSRNEEDLRMLKDMAEDDRMSDRRGMYVLLHNLVTKKHMDMAGTMRSFLSLASQTLSLCAFL